MKTGRAVSRPIAIASLVLVAAAVAVAGYLVTQPPGGGSSTSTTSPVAAPTVASSSSQASRASLSSTSVAQTQSATGSATFDTSGSPSSSSPSSTFSSSSSSSSPTSSSSSSTSVAPSVLDLDTAVGAHLSALSARDVSAALAAYSSGAVVQWEGETLSPYGMAGTYSGTSSIRELYQATISPMTELSLTVDSLNSSASSTATKVIANVVISGGGTSPMLGEFNITVDAQVTYESTGGAWLISQETWDFSSFHSQDTGGATTFPQWQVTGPPLPQRYSESPFKNWVYFYGGAAAAVALSLYLASLPVFMLIRKRRAHSG